MYDTVSLYFTDMQLETVVCIRLDLWTTLAISAIAEIEPQENANTWSAQAFTYN